MLKLLFRFIKEEITLYFKKGRVRHSFQYVLRLIKGERNSYAKIDQLRYLSQSALIEETAAPYVVRSTLFMVSLVILLLIVWAGFTQVQEVAVTEGEIIPSQHIQSIQHLEGGIISELKVAEGDLVERGQTLIVLDGTAVKRDLDALKVRKVSLEYNSMRLKSFINGTAPDFSQVEGGKADEKLIQEQLRSYNSMLEARLNEKEIIVDQIENKEAALNGLKGKRESLAKNVKLVAEEKNLKEQLYKKGYLSRFKFLEIKKQLNDVERELKGLDSEIEQANDSIDEYKNRLQSLGSNFIDKAYTELDQVEINISQIDQHIKKLEEQVERLEIKSPVYGYVKVLDIKTIGGVVGAGKVIAEIVPLEENLIVESQINPKDIGYLKIGQDVNVKISSYDFSRYGTINGKLTYISATTFANQEGERYYIGRISLDKNHVGHDPRKNIILPGMTAQADIITGSKSILAYLLKPIRNSINTAFSEK
ncbi:MAG: HlyD family type I secretion periplasmic adaptor subunit [Rickettsiaceae bacterium]